MALLGSIILVFIVIHMGQFWAKMHWGPIDYVVEQGVGPYLGDGSVAVGATLTDDGHVISADGQDLGNGLKNLYYIVDKLYTDGTSGIIWTLLYVISMVVLAFHLQHGFGSAFQSLGANHPKYNKAIKMAGYGLFIIVPLGFALIPIIMNLQG